jgi:hypothetical protein
MKMEKTMSKYTNLLDKIIELSEEYRNFAKSQTGVFSKELQEYFSQFADELEGIVEEEADE